MKIGIIGLGDIAQKAYLPVITQLPGVELIFCTRNADTLSSLASQYRIADTCSDYRDVLNFQPDAVMIHAATAVHPEIASFFLSHGIPTFVDKPLADSAAACEQLYEVAEKHQQPLYVGFNRRHIPLFNAHLSGMQNGTRDDLRGLRWEKHRYDLTGEIRTFLFDDFIHPLDSVNLFAKADLNDVYITHQMVGNQLARIDVQWQHGDTLLHASMNRQFGKTGERISAQFVNDAYEFDSFVEGKRWHANQESTLALKDWTPMLTSKGFADMIGDWLNVVQSGKLASDIIARNLASHQLAEAVCARVTALVR
ncbi:Gfo/Idh/MocA family oxidoreductase [Vibrio fluvialis]|uniref:Gfo/Idh/MocA family protein n=1 Tax=Vibrio fluvialis TaxID=676 RepID=UPI000C22A4D9|nr:Gfo/Idh/MocA family oxidoreductase [Vibrio fluvialis]EKO3412164.1 Gfo/Idh/MocA family oxidoreductase [Vibrio fluvialis]EKO3420131.1 Gfo/Idh/MocA family oxidoreductase [Vibrio fluvialis]EKO3490402.1 Gfo/Idh/MocA family oxidoreductase [Vibrio fluvialis]EKO3523686.1 Gfo/Idh/MocA family oxidoreductase [Vibrio fluvialis]EKO3524687.1 Gfo/Idh/MocA family oxidoreductase [Vibrio fluvialis]